MSTKARRCSVPVAVRCIDRPVGTITAGPPALPSCTLPSDVSKQVSPASVYQASGPPCKCAGAIMPGVNIASMYCTECCSPALIASGPISATCFPWEGGLRPSSSMVISHVLPNDSKTVPRAPLSLSAAARLS